jgi:hypothetical protein
MFSYLEVLIINNNNNNIDEWFITCICLSTVHIHLFYMIWKYNKLVQSATEHK